jgi:hypothetical protein
MALSLLGVGSNGVAVPKALSIGVDRRVGAHGTSAASGVRGGGAAGPVIRIGLGLKLFVDVDHAVTSTVHGIANFDIVVVPAELLVGLWAWEEVGAAKEEADTSNWTLLARI